MMPRPVGRILPVMRIPAASSVSLAPMARVTFGSALCSRHRVLSPFLSCWIAETRNHELANVLPAPRDVFAFTRTARTFEKPLPPAVGRVSFLFCLLSPAAASLVSEGDILLCSPSMSGVISLFPFGLHGAFGCRPLRLGSKVELLLEAHSSRHVFPFSFPGRGVLALAFQTLSVRARTIVVLCAVRVIVTRAPEGMKTGCVPKTGFNIPAPRRISYDSSYGRLSHPSLLRGQSSGDAGG